MPTWTALSQTQGREPAEALADACADLTPEPVGSGVFEIEDGSDRWEVGIYFTDPPDEIALQLLAAAHGAQPFAVSELPEVDWVAHVRREFSPVVAGRFFVHGSHDVGK
ncbi:MAG TPA: 50S ribosomal protein L11 methyltransferase, partial [Paracoccus sp. (in: a-proteobacteria)]|nr:50S ribosomal protein L11 methyltransferase [Paracoccus sp. (in: a-proteobacteria)]